MALEYVKKEGCGIVFYLPQEGRGIGLANKIAAYSLQEDGLDTVDANRALGLPDDCREYTSVRNMLADMKVGSIQLITNNPRKINSLSDLGVKVVKRIPSIVDPNSVNEGYLLAKEKRMEHLLGGSGRGRDPAARDEKLAEFLEKSWDEIYRLEQGM
jgi:GTP cyclohydrolase II